MKTSLTSFQDYCVNQVQLRTIRLASFHHVGASRLVARAAAWLRVAKTKASPCLGAVLLGAVLLPQSLAAANLYWDINGSGSGAGSATPSGNWGDANWSGDSTGGSATGSWMSGSNAVFSAGTDASGSYTISLAIVQAASGLRFEEGSATLSGGGIALSSPASINVAPGLKAIINSPLSGSAPTLGNSGEVILGGANTFSGNLTIQAGTLSLANDAAASTGAINTANLANILLRSATGAGTVTITNNLALGAASGYLMDIGADSASTLVLNGIISGSTDWRVVGPGTVMLGGTANNTFSAIVTVTNGATLVLKKDNALGSTAYGVVVGSSSTLALAGGFSYSAFPSAKPVTLSGSGVGGLGALKNLSDDNGFNGAITLAANSSIGSDAGDLSLYASISGAYNLTKVGPGIVDFYGANSYGNTVVSTGTLGIFIPGTTGPGSVTVNSGATLEGNGSAPGSVILSGTIMPDSSPAVLATGPQTWNGGAGYNWGLSDAGGSEGAYYGWASLNITGGLTVSATSSSKFNIDVVSLDPNDLNNPGMAEGWNSALEYTWRIAHSSTGITGFDPAAFNIITSNFQNSMGPDGAFIVDTSGNDLNLRFVHKPTITVAPVSQTTNECSTTIFSVTATGSATLHYYWSHNGSPIGTDAATLTLSAITPADAGTYSVVVSNYYNLSASASATLTVVDPPPVIAGMPANVTTNTGPGNLNCSQVVSWMEPVALDNCPGATLSSNAPSGSAFAVGVTPVIYIATDSNGQNTTNSFTITVIDDTPPAVVAQGITIQLDSFGVYTLSAADVTGLVASAADACGLLSTNVSPSSFSCADVGTTNVQVVVTDINGNATTNTEVVTVQDVTAPVVSVSPLTIQLDSFGNYSLSAANVASLVASATDACGLLSTNVYPSSFTSADVGTTNVAVVVADTHGNATTNTAVVTVQDVTAPVVTVAPLTIQLDSFGVYTLSAADVASLVTSATDASGLLSTNVSPSSYSCADVGTTNVQVVVTDIHGNATTNTAVVTVEDNLAPAVVVQGIVVQLDASGTYNLSGADVSGLVASATDACGILSTNVSPSSFTYCDVGNTNVTLTVTDIHGNVATNHPTITVLAPTGSPSVVYVDAAYGVVCGPVTFPASGGSGTYYLGYNAFTTIQAAISAVGTNGTVNVAAGTYPEQISISKAVALKGPNFGKEGADLTRSAEARIVPPSALNASDSPREWSKVPMVSITADGVSLDGFDISGDNPSVVGYSYAGMNVCAGLAVNSTANNVVFQNNIIEKVTFTGFASPGGQASPHYTGLLVTRNLFDSIQDLNQLGYGYAMDIQGTAGTISDNKVTNTRSAMEIQPYQVIGSPTVVSNNNISVWRLGIYYNYAEEGATAWTITGNQISACVPPAPPTGLVVWEGIRAETMRANGNGGLIISNIVDGSVALTDPTHAGWGGFTHGVWGLRYAGSGSDSTNVFFTGNSVQNVQLGLVHDAIADIVVTGNSFMAADSDIQLQNYYNSTGVPQGYGGTNNIDATGGNAYEGVDSTTASLVQLFGIEDKIQHKVDNAALGLVRVKAANIYVTLNSGSIQRGVGAASAGDTVNVTAGTFTENLTLNQYVILAGQGSGNSPASDTILTAAAANTPVVVITAGGNSSTDRLALRDVRVTGATGAGNPGSGIQLTVPGAHYTFDNVSAVNNGGNGLAQNLGSGANNDILVTNCSFSGNGEAGLRIPTGGSVDGLTVTGSHFDGNVYGFEVYMGNGSGSVFQNVNVSNSTFNNNSSKGIYAEKLANASFSSLTVSNDGFSGTFGAGININLKYAVYSTIQIADSDIANCGIGDLVNGGGVVIEARGTGSDSSYSSNPAALSGVTLSRLNVAGCPSGIAFGEPGKNNTQPTGVTVVDCGFIGNTTAGLADRLGSSAPTVVAVSNWWNSISGPSGAANPYGTGDSITGNIAFSPWLNAGDQDNGTIGFQPAPGVNYQPDHLAFTTQPVGAALNSPLATQPVVQVQDVNNVVTPWANPWITNSIGFNPGGGVLTGTNPQLASGGIATFAGLAVTVGGGSGLTLVASAPGLTSATSEPFNIGNPLPVLTSLNPAGAVTGSGGGSANVIVTGSGYVPTSVVLVDGNPVARTFNSASQLTATLSTALAGGYSVTVSNPAAGGGVSGALTFTVGNQPTVVYVDDDYTPASAGGHSWGFDAFTNIQQGVSAVASGGTVNVAAGTYNEAVTVAKALTLLGADAGSPCGGTGSSVINAGPAGTAITVAAANVTVDGFALQGAVGLSDAGYPGLVVRNNQVTAGAVGLSLQSIVGAFTVRDNCVTLTSQLAGATPTVGILLAGTAGSAATTVSGNQITGAFDGYLLYAVNTTPVVTVQGGEITGAVQGVAVINGGVAPFTTLLPSTFVVDGVSASGFTGAYPNAPQAGVYVYTGGGDNTAVVTGTITNVTITGVGKVSADSAGIDLADFSTATGVRQQITVLNSSISTNLNRGIFVSGSNAVASVSGSSILGNGFDPYGTGGNEGFGIIARNNAQVTVTDCFISNPAGVTSPYTVTALAADASTGPEGPTLTVSNSSVDNNSNPSGKLASQSAGTLNASGNWWNSTSDTTIASLMGGSVDFTPYLASGADTAADAGFQGDFSSLKVTALLAQTGLDGRVQEGVDLIADGALTAGSRLVDVQAGDFAGEIYVDHPLQLTGPNVAINPNTGTRIAEAVILPADSDPDPFSLTAVTLLYVDSSSVTIKGLTFDGDNPGLAGGVTVGAANVDACEAVAAYGGVGSITMSDNIVKNIAYAGADFYNYENSGGATADNYIQDNKFTNIGYIPYGYGIGVLIYNNFYAEVSGNGMTAVRVGIQTGNFFAASPGVTQSIHDNIIAATRRGIFHNLAYSGASAFSIHDNAFTAVDEAGGTRWDAIMLSSIASPVTATVQNNIITASPITQTTVGYQVWNNSASLTIQGGSVTGAGYGVWVNNYDGYASNGGSTSNTISGVTITGASLAGIYVKDNPLNSNGASVQATVTGNCSISGCVTGVLVEGPDASALVLNNPSSITGNSVGIDVDAGKALVQANNLTGNTVAAIRASNGAIVDAGACGGDITGLGISTGGNDLTGYLTGSAKAVVNNVSTVRAYGNNFGATGGSPSIAGAFTGIVSASQSGGLLATPSLTGATVECSGDIQLPVNTLTGFNGLGGVVSATDGVMVTNVDGPITGFNAPYDGTVTRIYTLTDACGQMTTSTQDFIIHDTNAPMIFTCATNETIVADETAQTLIPDVTVQVVAADNCTNGVLLSQIPAAGTSVGLGAHLVTIWAADNSGNSNYCTATITVIDTTAPVITTPADVTVTTTQAKDPYATGTATATDANPPVTISYDDDRSGLTACDTTGNIVRTWTAVDNAGNVTNSVQTITVVDDTNATYFTYVPADITVTNDPGVCGAVVGYAPTAMNLGWFQGFEDAGWVSGVASNNPSTDWNDYDSQMARVTSGTDGIDSRSGSAHGEIDSTTALGDDTTGAFNRLGGYSSVFGTGFRVAQDVYVNLNDPGVVNATDASGYAWDLSAAVNGQSGSHLRDFVIHAAAYTNSGVVIAASTGSADSVVRSTDFRTSANYATLTNSGWYTFQWIFRDTNDVLAVDLSVSDTNGTVLFTQTLSSPSDVISTVVGGHRYLWFTFINADTLAIDNTIFERNVPVVPSPASGSSFAVGTTTVTNTATDECGYGTNTTFNVTVNDTEPPSANVPADIVQANDLGVCGAMVGFTLPGQTDNCGVAGQVATPASGSSFSEGVTPVTVVVTDIHGNTATNTFNVTVNDTEPPVITTCATNEIIVADETAQALIPDVTVQVVATDNCDSPALSQIPAAGTSVGLGAHLVTIWAADNSGNSNYCTATITVIDTTAPVITTPADVTVTTTQAKDPYATGTATATDANPPVTISYDDDRSGLTACDTTGNIVRTWTAVDNAGNVTNSVQTITVVDDTNATYFTYVPADITVTNDPGVCGAVVGYAPTAMNLGWFQGFEDAGWVSGVASNNPSTDWNDYDSQMARVTSGTDGIDSRSGSAHGEIDSTTALGDDTTGAFNRLGGYSSVFGTGFRVAQDVYVNLNDPGVVNATDASGYAWDLSAAVNGQSGSHLRDFVIHAAAYTNSGVVIAASTGSADSVVRSTDFRTSANYATLTNSGWYTFQWIFRDTNDVLAVDLSVSDTNGTVLFTQTLSSPSDVISTVVGGHRYLWFTFINADTLAIDNTIFERNVPVVPSPASGSSFAVGTTTVTNTATDECGYGTNTTFNVTVNDTEPPSANVPADIVQANDLGVCGAMVGFTLPGQTDNCGVAGQVATPASGSSFSEGVTPVTVVVTDIHGNTATNTFNVTVNDTEPPSANVPADIVQANDLGVCGAMVGFTLPGQTDNCGVAGQVATPASGSSFSEGVTPVTVVVTDIHGNTATNTFNVTVNDTEPPVITTCATNEIIVADETAQALIPDVTVQVVATDNCDSPALSQIPAAGTSVGLGAHLVTIWAADNSGNSNYCTATITVIDTTAPVITTPADVTVTTTQAKDPYATGTATATDANPPVTISYDDDRSGLTACDTTGNIVRTWTAVDNAGNVTNSVQTITVVDDTNATYFTYVPADITVTNDPGVCGAVVGYAPTAMNLGWFQGFEDAGWVSGVASNNPSTDWNDYDSQMARVTSGTDGIDSRSGSAHGEIDSTTALGDDTTGAFNRLGGYSSVFGTGFRVAQDVYVNLNDPGVVNATDASGYAWDLSAAVNGQSGSHLRDFVIHAAAYTNSGVVIAASTGSADSVVRSTDFRTSANYATLTNSGWYTFQWIFRDTNDVLAVDLSVSDTNGTVLFTQTLSSPSDVISTVVGGHRYLWFTFINADTLAIDNTIFERNVPVVPSPASGSSFAVGTTTVTNTATDECGYGTNTTFNVTVNDTEPPSANVPADIVQANDLGVCGAMVGFTLPGQTDNCGVAGQVATPASGSSFSEGVTPVTVVVTDIHGNTATNTFNVTVNDTEPPSANVPADIVQANDLGVCGAMVGFTLPGQTDNCGVAGQVATPASGSSFSEGVTPVTVVVTDIHGNTATNTFNVTVNDTEPPSANVPANIVQGVDANQLYATVNFTLPGQTDNCDVAGQIATPPSGSQFPVGTNTVTVVVTDIHANTATNTFTVAVIALPAITGQPDSRTNNAGTIATFTVVADSPAALSYQWKKGVISLSDTGNVSGSTTATLTLTNVQDIDVADYSVVVSNLAGTVTSDLAHLTVIDAPVLVSLLPSSQTNNATTTAIFTVSATGTTPFAYQWTKITLTATNVLADGGNIFGATSNVLTITNVLAADQATYEVAISNPAGSVTTNGTLTVIDPAILVQPVSVTNYLGGPVSFSVTAVGTTNLSYQWYQGLFELPGETASTLTISSIGDSDAGDYTVVVTNGVGYAVSDPATLTITHPPVVTIPPASQTVNQGATVLFSVSANGTTPFHYQWQTNGVDISGANGDQLVLFSVTPANEAYYQVVITNVDGITTSAPPASLTVIVPPAFISQPVGLTTNAGSLVSFSATISGSASAYQWFKITATATNALVDGVNIAGATSNVLTLASVFGADDGNYSLRATNQAGVAVSDNATLVVIDPIITSQPLSRTNNAGTTAMFTVATVGTSPDYRWYKGAMLLTDGGNVSGATTTSLSLANVQAADVANYSVVVSNAFGMVTSAPPALLTVIDAPVITVAPQSLTNNAGTTAIFNVGYTGTAPAFQWFTNGVALSGATSATLTLNNVSQANAVDYTVVLTNAAGSATSAPPAHLTVIDPPVIVSQPLSRTNIALTTATFSVNVSGTTPFAYRWSKATPTATNVLNDGGNVSGSTSSNLTLINLLAADQASYFVTVTNPAGTVISSKAALVVIDPAILVPPTSVTNVIGGTATFSVTAVGTLPLGYQWQKNGGAMFGQTASNLVLTAIANSDEASYSVVVTNSVGSVTSAPALLVTFPPLITSQPTNLTVIQGQPASFSVTVNGQTPFTYQWQLNSNNILNATNRIYSIAAATNSIDAGSYRIIVSNPQGNQTSSNAILTVVVPPVITQQPTNVIAVVGDNVSFHVTATGTPLFYQWQLSSTNLPSATSATLALSSVTTNNAGTYSVTVTNLGGIVTSSNVTLAVYPTLVPVLVPLAYTNQEFTLTLTGVPTYQYSILGSSNLIDWVSLVTNASPYTFVDTNNMEYRFYRGKYQP